MTGALAALALATAVLVAIPGPNVALIVAHALRYGLVAGVSTVLGTTLGVALQLLLIVFGMAALIAHAAEWLVWLRWAGVAWLLWLGVQAWRAPASGPIADEPRLFIRGFVIALANPKTLLFNAAFLPQFLPADASPGDAALLAGVYLGVILIGDLLWASFAAAAQPWLARNPKLQSRLTGSFLIAAAIGLALARTLS